MGFLYNLLVKNLQSAGTPLPSRPVLNVKGGGYTLTDNPENNSTDLTLVGGSGSGGGATSLTSNFTQPSVGSTVTAAVLSTLGAVAGLGATVQGGGYYSVNSVVDSVTVQLLNQGASVNAAHLATVNSGSVVTFGGTGLPLAAQAPGLGTVQANVGGLSTPVHGVPQLISNLVNIAPYATTATEHIQVDGCFAHGDGSSGVYAWKTGTFTTNGPTSSTGTIIVPTGYATIGAWINLSPGNVYYIRDFGAKSDGATDATAAVQACFNAASGPSQTGVASVHATNDGTHNPCVYRLSSPVFGGSAGLKLTADPNTGYQQLSICDAFVVNTPTLTPPTFGTSGGQTYWNTGTDDGFALSQHCGSVNFSGWGYGSITTTTASFVQPAIGSPVASNPVAVVDAFELGIVGFTDQTYILGAGQYLYTVVDATHVNLTLRGFVAASETPTGGTVNSGANLGGNNGKPYIAPGFTFECWVDPIVAWPAGQGSGALAGSGGTNKGQFHSCFDLSLYNDQVTAQTRVSCNIRTTGTDAGASIKSGTTTIPAGLFTHVAAVYDGVGTVSLYVAGTRVGTLSQTGTINQKGFEMVALGALYTGPPTSRNALAGESDFMPQSVKMISPRFSPMAIYQGASFTPPTAPLTNQYGGIVVDFSNQAPMTIGPGGVDYSPGWVVATGEYGNGGIEPAWIYSARAFNTGQYCGGLQAKDVIITSIGGGIYTIGSIYGYLEGNQITGTGQGVTFDGFSYNWESRRNLIVVGINSSWYNWGIGVLSGSQYHVISGGRIQGGGWLIMTDVFAGINIDTIYAEQQGLGGIAAISDGTGPSLHITNFFGQNDSGTANFAGVAGFYVTGVIHTKIVGGYTSCTAPPFMFDNCGVVSIEGVWPAANTSSAFVANAISLPYFAITRQTVPVRADLFGFFNPFVVAGVTYAVSHGSASVSASNTGQLAETPHGLTIKFASQPNTVYMISAQDPATGNLTISPVYSGTTNGATTATVQSLWMPQSGTGFGPLVIPYQEDGGGNTVNMIAAGGMTMNVNDALWRYIKLTDVDGLLAGTEQVTMPLMVREWEIENATAQTLNIGGATGSTVSGGIAPGKRAIVRSDGTNFFRITADAS